MLDMVATELGEEAFALPGLRSPEGRGLGICGTTQQGLVSEAGTCRTQGASVIANYSIYGTKYYFLNSTRDLG